MNTELVERFVLAQRAVRTWLAELPMEKRSYLHLADYIGLRSSVHLTWLMRDDHLTPTMERALVMSKLLAPPPEPVLVQPCEVCGELHNMDWCAHIYGEPQKPKTTRRQRSRRKRKPRPPRFEVVAHDAELALKQLEKYYPGRFTLDIWKWQAEAIIRECETATYVSETRTAI